MAKLYPPNVEGKLPAFTGTTLVVPFSMNRAVGPGEVGGFQVQIRYINRDTVIYTSSAVNFDKYGTSNDVNFGRTQANCYATFDVSESIGKFTVGQFYRVQLAYKDLDGVIGYYSSVGVIKYTTQPEVTIGGMQMATTNKHTYDYTGIYHQTDASEKLYSSYMKLWDTDGNMLFESPTVIHMTGNDTIPDTATELFNIPFELEFGRIYKIRYFVITVNDLYAVSPEYRITITNNGGVEFEAVTDLVVKVQSNYTRGTVDITFQHRDPAVLTLKGMFRISRSENKQPYEWKFLRTIFCTNTMIRDICVPDYTVEQGRTYVYCIQQYNNYGLISNRSVSDPITVDFEDYYLIDTDKQLKIRYNPRISSMKNTVIENKINTIGSKYPYIVRSGVVDYKEFSLSGLVSYHMDDDEDFIKWADLGFTQTTWSRHSEHGDIPEKALPDYNITPANIMAERIFKLEVLDWLNNGKPKILKSPTEGNYLVVLMSVSMSPNDTVGRMLHTFNAQAVEIGPCDYDTLAAYKFFNLESRNAILNVPQWKTINLITDYVNPKNTKEKLIKYQTGAIIPPGESFTVIDIKDVIPNTKFLIITQEGTQEIVIGATGAYHAEITHGASQIIVPNDYTGGGTVTYQTTGPLITDFDSIHNYSDEFICGRQFIGYNGIDNIIGSIQNTRNKIVDITQFRLFKRDVIDLYAFYDEADQNTKAPMPSQQLYYDIYAEYPVPKETQITIGNTTAYASNIYDLNTTTSLFKIHWLNFRVENGEKIYYDTRQRIIPITQDDGSIYEETVLYYFGEVWEDIPNQGRQKVLKQFPEYSGYYYNPVTCQMTEDSENLYIATIGYKNANSIGTNMEYVSIEEKEHITYDSSFKPSFIRLNDGVIADLTYIYQTIIFSYEENKQLELPTLRANYDAAKENYWNYLTANLETQLARKFSIVRDNNQVVEITYTDCKSDTERARWRRAMDKEINTLLQAIKEAYTKLVDGLQLAILSDLTRG